MSVGSIHDNPAARVSGESRRKLIKRLALLAAAGYAAPTAVLISEPWACDKPNQPGPHGMVVSGPFC